MPRIIITEPDKTPQPYRLKLNRIVTKIGRAQDNDIILSDGSSSSHHCKIKRVEGGFILADSGSTNGIKHEDCKYSIIDLKDGETVQIGDHIDLEFTLSEEEIEELATEDFESHQRVNFPNENNPKTSKTTSEELPDEGNSKSRKGSNSEDNDEVHLAEAKPKSKKSSHSVPSTKASSQNQNKERRSNQVKQSNAGLSFIIFIILAILCFLAGLAIKHYEEYGTFIFS